MAAIMHSTGKAAPAAQQQCRKPAALHATTSGRFVTRQARHQAFAAAMAPVAQQTAGFRQVVAKAAAPAAPTEADKGAKPQVKEWYALVASADFFFNDPQNESLAEQMRERVRFYKEQNREIDFFLVPEPKWLEAKYPEQAKKVKRPAVALVSADKNWIVFMKLRLDRVLRFDMGPVPDSEVLAMGGSLPDFPGPEKWTAPYPRYTPGWWEVFYPKQA